MLWHDHKVRLRRPEVIAETALRCRKLAENENDATFNVIDFIRTVLPRLLKNNPKGPLKIRLFEFGEEDDLAYVTYKPQLTLHVDREVWSSADLGDPDARFILAHEVGHILLHDHDAQRFSYDTKGHAAFVQLEERAEWQANTFASQFLVPNHILESIGSIDDIASLCLVPKKWIRNRVVAQEDRAAKHERIAKAKTYTGDLCDKCCNFTLVPNGTCMKCDTCGSTTACS